MTLTKLSDELYQIYRRVVYYKLTIEVVFCIQLCLILKKKKKKTDLLLFQRFDLPKLTQIICKSIQRRLKHGSFISKQAAAEGMQKLP